MKREGNPTVEHRFAQVMDPLTHTLVAHMELSGTDIAVGLHDGSIYIQHDEAYEPIYMSKSEAKILIAALQCAVKDKE